MASSHAAASLAAAGTKLVDLVSQPRLPSHASNHQRFKGPEAQQMVTVHRGARVEIYLAFTCGASSKRGNIARVEQTSGPPGTNAPFTALS